MTETQRLREIEDIAKNQLSHKTDLPKSEQIRLNGKRVSIREIPFSSIPTSMFSIGLPVGVTPFTYLPPEERTYIKGRDWTIG